MRRYHFTTLWFHESLATAAVPFAVIVECKRYVYFVGYGLNGDDSVIGQIQKNFADILRERIPEASKAARANGTRVIDELRKEFVWNIRAKDRQTSFWPSFSRIEKFGSRLFSRKVENWQPPVAPAAVLPFFESTPRSFRYLVAA